ncbi:MAG: hypothetical protein FJ224_11990 [Lentisphaerae bacterium]|nr:hypothetical protein [Lentisphaerota bacterium]
MKAKWTCIATAVLGLTLAAWAGETSNESIRVSVDLADGSRIIGTPDIETVPVETSYAKMNIPLKQIRAMKIGEDHETVTFDLRNGDTLKGVISLGPIGLETVFDKVMIGVEHMKLVRVMLSGGPLPAGDGPLAFGGVNWAPLRTLFEVQGDKLVSLPKVRPGFNYGHGGNGRGPGIMTNIGNPDWRDYSVEFDFCMSGVDSALNPHGLPLDYRGGGVSFHVADARESWNECGWSGYNFNLTSDGTWNLECVYNHYCRVATGYGNVKSDGGRKLADGRGLTLDPQNGNRIRIEVSGTRIQIWVDRKQIVDVQDEKMTDSIGGKTLDHGGIGFYGGHDCMIWVRNFSSRGM